MAIVLMLIADDGDRDLLDRWLRVRGHQPLQAPTPGELDLVIAELDQLEAVRTPLEELRSGPAKPAVLVLAEPGRLEAALPGLQGLVDDVIELPLREPLLGLRLESHLRAREASAELAEARDQQQLANRERARFLAHVSHQLRGPLGVILGFSRLLETSDDASPETREFAGLILRAGETQLKLVEDLVDLAAAGAGELTLEIAPVKLDEVLAAAIAEISDAASARDVELRVDDVGELAVKADGPRLRQVFESLLSRAVQRSSTGGSVSITASRQHDAVEIVIDGAADDPALTVAGELLGAMGGTIAIDGTAGAEPVARVRLAHAERTAAG